MALTFTQADLDALKKALITGATSVRIGDQMVTYRTQKEILHAIALIESHLNPSSTSSSKIVQGSYRKGDS